MDSMIIFSLYLCISIACMNNLMFNVWFSFSQENNPDEASRKDSFSGTGACGNRVSKGGKYGFMKNGTKDDREYKPNYNKAADVSVTIFSISLDSRIVIIKFG